MKNNINVVVVNVGLKYADTYVDRMYHMVKRYLSHPFVFTCVTDHPRRLNPDIRQLDCSRWGLDGWFVKLKLLDGNAIPFDSLLFLDITMVLRDSLDPLVEMGRGQNLVALRDWHYDCLNSCTMWVEKGPVTQAIWDEYARGTRFPDTILHGDQDFMEAVLRKHNLEDQVAYWPPEWISSYKRMLKIHRTNPDEAHRLFTEARIIKFHGHPRPHELLHPLLCMQYLALRYPRYALRDWKYLGKEIKQLWQ